MKIQVISAAVLVAISLFSPAPALATVEPFSFMDNADGIFASGTLTVSDALNASGSHDVIAISGSVIDASPGNFFSDQISTLLPNPNQPDPFTTDGITFDNVAPLDGNGILFLSDANAIYGLRAIGGGQGELIAIGAATPSFDAIGTLSAGVPEPASWAMMLLGFSALGGALRATRRRGETLKDEPRQIRVLG